MEKDAKFDLDESCKAAFNEIKSRLVAVAIMVTPDWNKEFEIICEFLACGIMPYASATSRKES